MLLEQLFPFLIRLCRYVFPHDVRILDFLCATLQIDIAILHFPPLFFFHCWAVKIPNNIRCVDYFIVNFKNLPTLSIYFSNHLKASNPQFNAIAEADAFLNFLIIHYSYFLHYFLFFLLFAKMTKLANLSSNCNRVWRD